MGFFNKRKDIEERSLSYKGLIESLNSNKVYINKESVLNSLLSQRVYKEYVVQLLHCL